MSRLGDSLTFSRLIVTRVSGYVTGGVLSAGIAVYEHFQGQSVQWRAFLAGLVAFLIVGAYRTWQDEHRQGERLQHQLGQLQNQLAQSQMQATHRNSLGRFLAQGQDFAHRASRGFGLEARFELNLINEVGEWVGEVEAFLDRNFDQSYSARFRQDALFHQGRVSAERIGEWQTAYEQTIRQRCRNLEMILTELRG